MRTEAEAEHYERVTARNLALQSRRGPAPAIYGTLESALGTGGVTPRDPRRPEFPPGSPPAQTRTSEESSRSSSEGHGSPERIGEAAKESTSPGRPSQEEAPSHEEGLAESAPHSTEGSGGGPRRSEDAREA